jgi:hypothetical protein
MRNNERKSHPVLQKLGLSALTVLIVVAVVFATYNFTLNKEDSKYINDLYNFKLEVDKSNSNVAEAIKSIDSLDVNSVNEINAIESKISSASSDLQGVVNKLALLKPPSKYEVQYNGYKNGVYLNRRIFMQANLILKNTKSSELKSAINSLTEYITQTSTAYEASKLKKAYIKLPIEIIQMSDKVNTYAFNVYKDYENKTQSLEQYTSYFKSMDSVLANFNTSKEDLNSYINFIKSNTLTMDDVYARVEGKMADITQIQATYTALSVPPKMGDRHKQLDDILKSYFYYCQDFKTALNKFEEAGTDITAQNDVTSTFNDLSNDFKTITTNFTNYWNAYNNDKDRYSDIKNL